MDLIKYISVIMAFIVVMGMLLLTTKYLSYKSKKLMKGNYMQIIESLSLGVNNRLHLVKVDKEFFIIAATNKNVEFLSKVNISDYVEEEVKNPISEVIDFKSVLKKYVNGFSFRNSSNTSEVNQNEPVIDSRTKNSGLEPGDSVFKSNLEKLKHLSSSLNDRRGQDEKENHN